MSHSPRIALIHALTDSQVPAWQAFETHWPEADIHNVLDDSLAMDLAAEGTLTEAMVQRFITLGKYAASTGFKETETQAILFTCSAFGPAIDAAKKQVDIPVLRPNEAAFEEALNAGNKIGLLVSFEKALPPLTNELKEMAAAAGKTIEVHTGIAEGALAALKAGNEAEHDRLVAECAATLEDVDALVLCQFSLARAAASIPDVAGRIVLTTPGSAIAKLKRLLA